MSEKLAACVKCGKPLEQPKTGRPRLYCGEVCRQAAAYEIKRVTRLLASLEAEASFWRSLPDNKDTSMMYGAAWRERLTLTEARIASGEARLAKMLGQGRGRPLGLPPELGDA